jgi:predicted acylesterase/phospholipase RssA
MSWKPKVLVISGGGFKGIFATGALSALDKFDILSEVDTYCGTSIGAYLCALLCVGFTTKEIIDIFWRARFGDLKEEFEFQNILRNRDICDYVWFRQFIHDTLVEKMKRWVGKHGIPYDRSYEFTLSDLYRITGKTLKAVSVERVTGTIVVLDHIGFPNMPVVTVRYQKQIFLYRSL